MPAIPPTPQLDIAALALPTDKITLKAMRERERDVFVESWLTTNTASDVDAIATYCWEVLLAKKAFARTMGQPTPSPEWSRAMIVEMLDGSYRRYGLTAGAQGTREAVRGIEAQAANQAERYLGNGP